MSEQMGLDMLDPKKKVISYTMKTFKNRYNGQIVEEKMAEKFDNGTSSFSVYDARDWKFISSREVIVGDEI